MRWGRKDDSQATNEVGDGETTGGAHADHTRIDEADREVYDGDADLEVDRASVVDREREALGGVKVGSAFFGWLAATGMAVILTALAAATGAAVAVATGNEVGTISENTDAVNLAGAIVLLVVFFIAYYCGGYVAGRMARFNGMKQGFAVWVWAIVIAVVVAIVAAVAGDQYDVLSQLNNFPRIPTTADEVTRNDVFAALAIAVVALFGSLAGGLGGMRFHRQVDKAGLGR